MMKLNIQLFAHKKGGGSTSNGRDSAGRRLGAKAADGQATKIIIPSEIQSIAGLAEGIVEATK